MEKRRLGRLNHESTVAIFGACALGNVTQEEADRTIERCLQYGINHFDVARSYGEAEVRLKPWMPRIRQQIFLATKTGERTEAGARRELEESLQRLGVDYLDLIQLHAVTSFDELDQVMRPGGALQAVVRAKEEGLVGAIGITGHGHMAPRVHREALRRYPFDTVLTPLNFVLEADDQYRRDYEALVDEVKRQDVGLMTIKAIARGPQWPEGADRRYNTWYQPFDTQEAIQEAVSYVLTHPEITGFATACDVHLLPMVLYAAEHYRPLSPAEAEAVRQKAHLYASPFVGM
ncbi:MAG: aldo/keto reductase [Firmicutes bacterium]|nr:aldo/keto reductase [Bacillota bacterium]